MWVFSLFSLTRHDPDDPGGPIVDDAGGAYRLRNAPPVTRVARGQASVTIGRPNTWYGAAASVDIDANGARIASLAAGDNYTGPVAPGPATFTATCWSSLGRYTIHFNAEVGRSYAFEVSSRHEQIAATVAFGVIELAADTAINDRTSLALSRLDYRARKVASATSAGGSLLGNPHERSDMRDQKRKAGCRFAHPRLRLLRPSIS